MGFDFPAAMWWRSCILWGSRSHIPAEKMLAFFLLCILGTNAPHLLLTWAAKFQDLVLSCYSPNYHHISPKSKVHVLQITAGEHSHSCGEFKCGSHGEVGWGYFPHSSWYWSLYLTSRLIVSLVITGQWLSLNLNVCLSSQPTLV